MPRYAGEQANEGIPVVIKKERYQSGEYPSPVEGPSVLGISPTGKTIPLQVDSDGYLRVYLEGSSAPVDVEQHFSGDSDTNAKGIVSLGDDGTYLRILKVNSDGKLQVDTDIVQYQEGASVTTPVGIVTLGYDGSDVRVLATDANGLLKVANFPTSIQVSNPPEQHAEGDSATSVKGNVALGSDGSNVHILRTDANGQLYILSIPAGQFLTGADVTVTAGATVQILGADSFRLSSTIGNLHSNTEVLRIGDSTCDATHGLELAPGEQITIESGAAVYAYNPGSSDQNVCLAVTRI